MTSDVKKKQAILGRILSLCEDPSAEDLPLTVLASWMSDEDIDIQGAAYALLNKAGRSLKVVPWPAAEDIEAFFRSYLARCMREDANGDWTCSRYEAGWEIAAWMAAVAEADDTAQLLRLRDWLADLYTQGSPAERSALVNAALEHIFERPSLRRLFKDWKHHPVLSQAYQEATLWVKEGGNSALVGRYGPARDSRRKG